MPWTPRYTREEARAAIEGAGSWVEVLAVLDYAYHGKNIATLRKCAARWGIPTDHLSDRRGVRRMRSDADLRKAVAASLSWAETLRRLGYCATGGNWKTLRKRVVALGISTDHFDPYATARRPGRKRQIPLEDVLVRGSSYSRYHLKRRLYESGLKDRRCELCGQDELWQGKRIGLILDHGNGVRDDNRLQNLRIVCPNCAATLVTHCGRKNRLTLEPLPCRRCKKEFIPRYPIQRYCSRECGTRWDRRGTRRMGARRAERPSHDRLLHEVKTLGYAAVGRKYGVSDNAIRKWVLAYEREKLIAEGRDSEDADIPTRTSPNGRRGAETPRNS